MWNRYVGVGIFVVVGTALFATAVFLIGNQHNIFAKHVELFTDVKNLNGLTKGAKVLVGASTRARSRTSVFPDRPRRAFDLQFKSLIRCVGS